MVKRVELARSSASALSKLRKFRRDPTHHKFHDSGYTISYNSNESTRNQLMPEVKQRHGFQNANLLYQASR